MSTLKQNIARGFDPLEKGRRRRNTNELPLLPQDMEDEKKRLKEKTSWIKIQDIPDEDQIQDFENQDLGLGCRKKREPLGLSNNLSSTKKNVITKRISRINIFEWVEIIPVKIFSSLKDKHGRSMSAKNHAIVVEHTEKDAKHRKTSYNKAARAPKEARIEKNKKAQKPKKVGIHEYRKMAEKIRLYMKTA